MIPHTSTVDVKVLCARFHCKLVVKVTRGLQTIEITPEQHGPQQRRGIAKEVAKGPVQGLARGQAAGVGKGRVRGQVAGLDPNYELGDQLQD